MDFNMKKHSKLLFKTFIGTFFILVCMFVSPLISATTTTLVSPSNNFLTYSNQLTNFSCSGIATIGNNLTNITLYTNYTGTFSPNYTVNVFTPPSLYPGNWPVSVGTTSTYGMKFYIKTNANFANFTVYTGSNPTRCILKTATGGTTLYTGVVTDGVCPVTYNFVNNTGYRILFDNSGGTWTVKANNTLPALYYPIITSSVNYTTGIDSVGSEDATTWYALANITFSSLGNFNMTFPGGLFLWNCYSCDNSSNCAFAPTNYSFYSSINSVTYNTTSTIGNIENYIINYTGANLNSIIFNYNGTQYNPNSLITDSGGNFISTNTLNVPFSATTVNRSFYWNLNLDSNTFNSSTYNQTINSFGIDNCTTFTTKILNLTMFDEQTQKLINGTASNGTIQVSLTLYPVNQYPNPSYIVGSFAQNYFNTNNASVCINVSNLDGSIYYMDAQFRYFANDYVTKLYNIQKYLLTNTTTLQNITLYDLNSSVSTSFALNIKDTNYLPITNAVIVLQRKYVSNNSFQTVEAPLSDNNGNSVLHIDLNGVVYTITILQNGVTLGTFANINPICVNPLISICSLNLFLPLANIGFNNYNSFGNLNYILSFNPTTRTVSLIYNTVDNSATLVNITSRDIQNNATYCSSQSLSSAGTLNCVIPLSYGNVTFIASVYNAGNLVIQNVFTITQNPVSLFGYDSFIYAFIFILIIVMMFITEKKAMLISLVVSLIILSLLNLFIVKSWIGATSSIVFLVVGVIILIFKMSQRGREGL